jgi:hypothetical protein
MTYVPLFPGPCPYRVATISRQPHTLTTGFSWYILQLLASGLHWLLTANLHLQLSIFYRLPSWTNFQHTAESLCSLSMDCVENTASSSSFIVACTCLFSNASGIVACLWSCCLVMAVFLVPYSSSQASGHNMIGSLHTSCQQFHSLKLCIKES